ncbi:MAG: aminoglycoside phosphotransferase family protein [Alphaproteobacteria bacterium]|nr:aminoglycoside phosphotransferase family protein [Alphaproteobacteria bacterium]
MTSEEPSTSLAAAIASRVTGSAPVAVQRFATGARHHVFDIGFKGRPPVVVRIGDTSARTEMAGAVYLSGLLRPRGVPVPAILAEDVEAERPWLVLERLPGTDLGAVIAGLSDGQLDWIAARVVEAQAIVAHTGAAGRYGYAVRPEQAPHSAWSHVLDAHLARSRRRIAAAGLFDASLVDRVQNKLTEMRDAVDRIAPTPFLHDTTTRNVIITPDGGFSGIVDVDDLCFGDPRYPAALTLAVLMAQGGPVGYVTAWLHYAGQTDDCVFRLYVNTYLLDLMSEHGQAFNRNELPSTPEARRSLRQVFEACSARIGQ